MRLIKTLLIIISLIFFIVEVNATQVPKLIHYQGVIDGAENDDLQVEFRIWESQSLPDDDTIGQLIWGMRYTLILGPGGCFSILLGNETDETRFSIPGAAVNDLTYAFDGSERYLGLKIYSINNVLTNANEIYPRKQIASTPFAVHAAFSDNGVPVGTIVASMLSEDQFAEATYDNTESDLTKRKWTLADGKTVESSQYVIITGNANVPDLRGMFLRGLNVGRDDGKEDPDGGDREGGNIAGSYQSDQNLRHNHSTTFWYVNTTDSGNKYDSLWNVDPPSNQSVHSTTFNGGSEARPRNIAVYYYIKIN